MGAMFLWIALGGCAIGLAADLTEGYMFNLIDITANSNYEYGGKEFHCFDSYDGVKTYVRGTYGELKLMNAVVPLMLCPKASSVTSKVPLTHMKQIHSTLTGMNRQVDH